MFPKLTRSAPAKLLLIATLLAAATNVEAGGITVGLDWRVSLDEAWARVGHDRAVMGNLDPVALFAGRSHVRREAEKILAQAAGRPGHVFNLGHGILPETPVEAVIALVEAVHELSRRDSAP